MHDTTTRPPAPPRAQERARLFDRHAQRLQRRVTHLDRLSRRYGWARLAVFFGGLAVSVLCFHSLGPWPASAAAALTLLAFGGLVTRHGRVETRLKRHTLLTMLASRQSARLALQWSSLPPARLPAAPPHHPFAADLDLLGERSLHRLIDTAISQQGSERLRDWLIDTAPDLARIQRRQSLVRALTPRRLFRDKLALTAALWTRGAWDGQPLPRLLEQATPLPPRALLLAPLVLLADALFALSLFSAARGPALMVVSIVLAGVLFFARMIITGAHLAGAAVLKNALEAPGHVFAYLETAPYGGNVELHQFCAPLWARASERPSLHLRRLTRLATLAGVRGSWAWPVITAILPLDLYAAYRLSRATARVATLLPQWLEVWFELEALGSLANLAALHPEYAFPDLRASGHEDDCPIFQARALGHPLIPDKDKVVNDFTLGRLGEVGLITGSNMAGKSSFLRTVGINLCLAYAGGPVNATMMRAILFRVFTSIAISDSIVEGYSYFYAEVRRLKALLTALEQHGVPPLFFLIDEIFRGTNNRERLLGGRAYLRAITGRHGAGLVSTHDLGLVALADTLSTLTNYHFRDAVVDGGLVFDYTLRPGPSPTTNALAIMHMEGLPVQWPRETEDGIVKEDA